VSCWRNRSEIRGKIGQEQTTLQYLENSTASSFAPQIPLLTKMFGKAVATAGVVAGSAYALSQSRKTSPLAFSAGHGPQVFDVS
jgi:hypothetical protein